MRFVFDIVHPAHVHFFRFMHQRLLSRGHAVLVIARDKDVTHALLEAFGIPYVSYGSSGRKGTIRQLGELLGRDRTLWRAIRQFGADVVVTRNPSGVQAARLAGAVGVFDTDDGRAAGLHFRLAAPFAHYITTPDCLAENYGAKHVKYKGYKQSTYLHPNHFTPDPTVLDQIGVSPHEDFFVARFVDMSAFHDRGEAGMLEETRRTVIRRLQERGRVFVSWEGAPMAEFVDNRIPVGPEKIHDMLAFARLYVGDSQTMAAEAALLGTPSLRMSSFARRLHYLTELERDYGLVFSYTPAETHAFFDRLELLLTGSTAKAAYADAHARLIADKADVVAWYVEFLESIGRQHQCTNVTEAAADRG